MTQPSVINLSWLRPSATQWGKRPKALTIPGLLGTDSKLVTAAGNVNQENTPLDLLIPLDQVSWIEVYPLQELDILNKFARKNASHKDVKRLCESYGYLEKLRDTCQDYEDNNSITEDYHTWARELNLIWLTINMYHAINTHDTQRAIDLIPGKDDLWQRTDLSGFTSAVCGYVSINKRSRTVFTPDWSKIQINQGKTISFQENSMENSLNSEAYPVDEYGWLINPPDSHAYDNITTFPIEISEGEEKEERGILVQDFNEAYSEMIENGIWDEKLLKQALRELIIFKTGKIKVQLQVHKNGFLLPVLTPPNLLAGLWLMLSQEVANGTGFLRCISCGRIFVNPKPNGHRDRKLCKRSCKKGDIST